MYIFLCTRLVCDWDALLSQQLRCSNSKFSHIWSRSDNNNKLLQQRRQYYNGSITNSNKLCSYWALSDDVAVVDSTSFNDVANSIGISLIKRGFNCRILSTIEDNQCDRVIPCVLVWSCWPECCNMWHLDTAVLENGSWASTRSVLAIQQCKC